MSGVDKLTLIVRKPTPGEQLYADWCDAPGSDRERYWFSMNRADKAAWEKLGASVNNLRGAVAANDDAFQVICDALSALQPPQARELVETPSYKAFAAFYKRGQ